MSQTLTPVQSALLALARRPEGIDETEAGQLVEAHRPLEREERYIDDTGAVGVRRKPGVWGTPARGRAALRTLADAGWLTYDTQDEVFRVGGGSPGRQRPRRPRRPTRHLRPGRVTA